MRLSIMMVLSEHDMLQHTHQYGFYYFLPIARFSEKKEIGKVGVPSSTGSPFRI